MLYYKAKQTFYSAKEPLALQGQENKRVRNVKNFSGNTKLSNEYTESC